MGITDYEKIVGKDIIDELKLISRRLRKKKIQCINSTKTGGGVAEILSRIVPLLNDLGIDTRWDVISADLDYFAVTKSFHNALHGRKIEITQNMFDKFLATGKNILSNTEIYGDIVFVHDPQPIMLVDKKGKNDKWIWRCHVDVSNPYMEVWEFLRRFIEQYDVSVFSSPKFARELEIPQFLVTPSVDPFSEKNRDLTQSEIDGVLKRYGIEKNKPIVTQVSRFDYLKDPIGVIEAYRLVKKYINCQLILAGNRAADDPETDLVLNDIMEKKGDDPDIHVLLIGPEKNDFDVNALQRASDVIIQKSIREGFAITITEALWKERPVIASAVGGIPLQISHRYSGLLCHTVGGAALGIRELLNNPEYAKRLAANGKEHVRRNFLSTRHLRDYMLLFLYLYNPEDIIYL
ncbi:MAG: glycosyl transferase family 1 [Omnitrophica bacterium RBG_13_46_9]|nr:MAG: glycosyl transferase family 1 [Omnitrophica bacterium RBG_13_46_9]